jgi:hypothetical protein
MAKSKGEEEFIEQKTRELLVVWADHCLKSEGQLPDFEGDPSNQAVKDLGIHKDYWDLALSRGWLTKKTPRTLTSAGWGVAAAFLKR